MFRRGRAFEPGRSRNVNRVGSKRSSVGNTKARVGVTSYARKGGPPEVGAA